MDLVTQFLTQLRNYVIALDGENLDGWLQVEPGLTAQAYFQLREELRQSFGNRRNALESMVDKCMPEVDDPPEGTGSPWPSFISFVKEFLLYWKDAEFDDLMALQESLSGLLTYVSSPLFKEKDTRMN